MITKFISPLRILKPETRVDQIPLISLRDDKGILGKYQHLLILY